MDTNPELRRLLWQEFTIPRLVVGPLLLIVVFVITSNMDNYLGDQPWITSANVAMLLFLAITLFWGGLQVGNSLLQEVKQKTWDGQRLSAMTPTTLMWGKLLGNTAYAWLLGAPCLVIYTLGLNGVEPYNRLLVQPMLLLLATLDWQVLSLVVALITLPRLRQETSRQGSNMAMTTMMIFLFWACLPFVMIMTPVTSRCGDGCIKTSWFHMNLQINELTLITLLLALPWLLLAGWRLLARELQYRPSPWPWLSFCLFVTLYLAGWFLPRETTGDFWPKLFSGSFLALMPLVYLFLLVEERDALLFQRLRQYLVSGEWKAFLSHAPVWLLTLVYLLGLTLLSLGFNTSQGIPFPPLHIGGARSLADSALPLTLLVYMVRDVVVVLLITTMTTVKRPEAAALLILISLYLLLPWPFELFDLEWVMVLFRPTGLPIGQGAHLVIPLLEVILLSQVLRTRWQRVEV